MPFQDLKKQFDSEGYFFIRGVLNEEECDRYTAAIDHRLLTHAMESRFLSNGPNLYPELWPLIVHDRIVEILRAAVAPDLRYTLCGDLHVNHNAHQWHRDFCYKHTNMPIAYDDVETPFRVVKIGIYTDPGESGFAVVPKSTFSEMQRYFGIDIYQDPYFHDPRGDELARADGVEPPVLFRPRKGDMVAMDMRLFHAGGYVDPETGLPVSTSLGPKKNIWLTYGADNEWTRKVHYHYCFVRKDLMYSSPSAGLIDLLREKGLFFSGLDDEKAQDPAWFMENIIVPPYITSDDTAYGVTGSPGWYAKVAESHEKGGYPFSAERCFSRACSVAEGEIAEIDSSLERNGELPPGPRKELEKQKIRLEKQMSAYQARRGVNCVNIGMDDEAAIAFREAVRLNPFNLKARLKSFC